MATRSVLSACCDWGFLWVVNPTITVPDVFSFGGRTASSASVQTHRGYTISTDAWSGRALALSARFMGSTAIDGEGYSMAGIQTLPLQSVLSYAAQPDSWSSKTSTPTPARGLCAASTLGLFGILTGGIDTGGTDLSDVDLYDSSGDSWAAGTAFSPPRNQHGAESSDSTTAYVFGGEDNAAPSNDMADTDEYDKTGDSWTAKTDMSLAKLSPKAALLNGKIYTTTGRDRAPTLTDLKTTDEYTPSGDSWAAKTDAPSPERTVANFTASGSKGYLHHGTTGTTGSLTYIGDTDEYDPSADSWTSVTTDSVSGGPRGFAGDFSL